MNCNDLALALGDYVDAPAGAVSDPALDAHLAGCPACRAMVADLGAIRGAARTLAPLVPPERIWSGVAARVAAATAPRIEDAEAPPWARLAPGAWRWEPVAAAAMLVLVASSLAWIGGRLSPVPARTSTAARAAAAPGPAGDPLDEFRLAEAHYAVAIASLEAAADGAAPEVLDGATAAALRTSLEDIDAVIVDTRAALAREPESELSQEGLLDALGSKVALLQDTVALINETYGGPTDADQGQNQ